MSWLTSGVGSVIGGLLGVGGSMLGSQDKTTTVKTTLPPELQGPQSQLLSLLQGMATDPSAGLAPIKQASQDQVNRNYAEMPQLATTKLAARGFGSSGDVGKAVYDTEGARLSDLSGLEGQMTQLASQRQLSASQILQSIISAGRGTSITAPGNILGNGLSTASNAFDNFATLKTLQQMLNNGGNLPSTPNPAAVWGSQIPIGPSNPNAGDEGWG
jgi:hypothetical protein